MSSNKLQNKNDVLPQRIGIAVRNLEVCGEVPLWLQRVLDGVGLLLLFAKLEDRVGIGLAHQVCLDEIPGLHQVDAQVALEAVQTASCSSCSSCSSCASCSSS